MIDDLPLQIRGMIKLLPRALAFVVLGGLLGSCASGLPDPVLLQGGSLTGTGDLQTSSTQTLPRSDASRVLSALAAERVLGGSAAPFDLLGKN